MKKIYLTTLAFAVVLSVFAQQKRKRENLNNLDKPRQKQENKQKYSLQQAMSDKAQLHTIAFSGLAFITGNKTADTFMPPGKIADFFGFQYMRDVDIAGYGHNTTFLTKAANNILTLLNDEQLNEFISLAKKQAPLYINFAYNRYPVMDAFRKELDGKLPNGSSGLNDKAVAEYLASLYKNFDAPLSYERAVMFGNIACGLTQEQKSILNKYTFNDYNTWTEERVNENLKRGLSQVEFVAVMTYASEFFSWYKGSIDADVYFCPERHGTYYGGFFMKDYPAMGNPGYFIPTNVTGDSGAEFIATLNENQRKLITSIPNDQRVYLNEIGSLRLEICTELRKSLKGEVIDKEKIYSLIERYGYLDGMVSSLYAKRFSAVNKTLTAEQREKLVILRNLDIVPEHGYRFSTPIPYPEVPFNDYLFGIGNAPENKAAYQAPASFSQNPQRRKGNRNQ